MCETVKLHLNQTNLRGEPSRRLHSGPPRESRVLRWSTSPGWLITSHEQSSTECSTRAILPVPRLAAKCRVRDEWRSTTVGGNLIYKRASPPLVSIPCPAPQRGCFPCFPIGHVPPPACQRVELTKCPLAHHTKRCGRLPLQRTGFMLAGPELCFQMAYSSLTGLNQSDILNQTLHPAIKSEARGQLEYRPAPCWRSTKMADAYGMAHRLHALA
jgi:hypothetical protein